MAAVFVEPQSPAAASAALAFAPLDVFRGDDRLERPATRGAGRRRKPLTRLQHGLPAQSCALTPSRRSGSAIRIVGWVAPASDRLHAGPRAAPGETGIRASGVVGAEGETAPETLRRKDRGRRATLWKAAPAGTGFTDGVTGGRLARCRRPQGKSLRFRDRGGAAQMDAVRTAAKAWRRHLPTRGTPRCPHPTPPPRSWPRR